MHKNNKSFHFNTNSFGCIESFCLTTLKGGTIHSTELVKNFVHMVNLHNLHLTIQEIRNQIPNSSLHSLLNIFYSLPWLYQFCCVVPFYDRGGTRMQFPTMKIKRVDPLIVIVHRWDEYLKVNNIT